MFSRFLACAVAAVAGVVNASVADRIDCSGAGAYGGHLQGVAAGDGGIYWSFTRHIVKTDFSGRPVAVREAPSHQGDLCVKDGTVYVAVNRGRFNQEKGAVSEVMSYDAETLKPLETWPLPEMPHGAGGMTWRGDRFFIVGGLPATHECNYVYEYTKQFKFVRRHDLPTGFTLMGIQTAAYEEGRFLFGIYGGSGNPAGVIAVEDDLKTWRRYTGQGSVGILRLDGGYYVGVTCHDRKKGGHNGYIERVPGFCTEKFRYSPPRNGGRIRIFFAGRDKTGWTDCGYALAADGYRPLTKFAAAFRPLADASKSPVPAVCIGSGHAYSLPDLVRGVRRAAECDEELAICFAGVPEQVADDERLSAALSAIRREAAALGLAVHGL